MLVQSSSGKVYAVLADNQDFELAILPGLQLISTSVVLGLRCRYKFRTGTHFDPMLVPKRVLAGGTERSDDTLRSVAMFNTGFTIEQVGKAFPALVAEKVQSAAGLHYLTYDPAETPGAANFISPQDIRPDFQEDFAKLVTQAISPIYPAKDLSTIPPLTTEHDFRFSMQNVEDKHTKLTAVPDVAATDETGYGNVTEISFANPVDKPEPADV